MKEMHPVVLQRVTHDEDGATEITLKVNWSFSDRDILSQFPKIVSKLRKSWEYFIEAQEALGQKPQKN